MRGSADIARKVVKRRHIKHTAGVTRDVHELGIPVSVAVGNVERNNVDTQGCANLIRHD